MTLNLTAHELEHLTYSFAVIIGPMGVVGLYCQHAGWDAHSFYDAMEEGETLSIQMQKQYGVSLLVV